MCTIPLNSDAGSSVADIMNGNLTQWNVMIRNMTTEDPNELRLMDAESALRMVNHSALMRDVIHFNTQPGIQWINDAFQTRIEKMEAELRTMVNPVARGSSQRLILGEPSWNEGWTTASRSPSNCDYHSLTYKDVTGSKDLASRSCSVD